jgi:hypothetical protein
MWHPSFHHQLRFAPNPDLTSAISTQELEAFSLKVTPPFWIVAFILDLRPSKEPNKVSRNTVLCFVLRSRVGWDPDLDFQNPSGVIDGVEDGDIEKA